MKPEKKSWMNALFAYAQERIVKLSATGREFKDPQILSRTEIKDLTRPGVKKRQVSF